MIADMNLLREEGKWNGEVDMQNNEKLPRDGPILVKMFVH